MISKRKRSDIHERKKSQYTEKRNGSAAVKHSALRGSSCRNGSGCFGRTAAAAWHQHFCTQHRVDNLAWTESVKAAGSTCADTVWKICRNTA